MLVKRFDSPVRASVMKIRLYRMMQKASESLPAYIERYKKAYAEAGCKSIDPLIFISSLSERYCDSACRVVSMHHHGHVPEDLKKVMDSVASLAPEHKRIYEELDNDGNEGDQKVVPSDDRSKRRFIPRPSGDKGTSHRPQHSKDSSGTNATVPCRYCSRPWKSGHTCREYYDDLRTKAAKGDKVAKEKLSRERFVTRAAKLGFFPERKELAERQ